jgi:ribosomal protein S18 acetylase RimI-like enzyme
MPPVDVVRTYLEMRAPDALRGAGAPPGVRARVERVERPSASEYRALYAGVGAAYHWRDRLAWDDERLATYLADPAVSVWVLLVDGARAGYFELKRVEGDVEIVYFGLTPAFIGRGLGKYLLTRAVEEAWRAPGAARVWLHTCTLDDRAALPNYLARGFVETRRESYVTDI